LSQEISRELVPLNKAVKEKGWGFCGRECYLGKVNKKEEMGILRQLLAVDVLPDKLCHVFLKESTAEARVRVKPKILCVGQFKPWRTQLWKKKGQQHAFKNHYQKFQYF